MTDRAQQHPQVQVLGRLLVMQQTLVLLPHTAQVAAFVRQAFLDVPGVTDCTVRMCPDAADATRVPGADSIPIRTATCAFGVVRIGVGSEAVYRCYRPFLDNIAQMVATVLEARRSAAELAQANEKLTLAAKQALLRTEERFRNIMEFAPIGIAATAPDGRFLEVNNALCRMLGYSRDELQGLRLSDITYPDAADDTSGERDSLMRGELASFSRVKRSVRKDGQVIWSQISCSLVGGDGGGDPYFITHIEDVTRRRRDEEGLRIADTVYRNSSEGILLTDPQGRIAAVNPAFTRLTGWTLEEVSGKTPAFLQSGRQSDAFYQDMWAQLAATGHWHGEVWNRRKDGSEYAEYLSINADRGDNGQVEHYVGLFSDITARKRNEEIIWRQANFDALTGLPNRRLFLDRLEQQTKRSRRSRNPFALIFVDLDRFKEINDTLGHGKGDLLLVEASRRLLACVRESDSVSRLAGDEFTVILHEAQSADDAEPIVRRILLALSQPYDLQEGDTGHMSASVGVAFCPRDSEDWERLLQYADQAMYAAKTAGRNCHRYFTAAMQVDMQQRASLTSDLRQALKRRELEVFYQGIVDSASGAIIKAEALLRWHHPSRGMIAPAQFIPLAEESGLILEIGAWVLEEVIRRIGRWRERTGRLMPVSVNKSPVQFFRGDHRAWIDALERSGLPASCVTVEITESLLIQQAQRVNDALADFQRRGIEVAIDDFGTGFSSLAYLNEFHIDYLKIDRSFVAKLGASDDAQAVTEAIIVMAHKLGIRTVAEGVETPGQRDILLGQGCDLMQGFLFHRPVPAAEFEKTLLAPARLLD